MEDYRNTSSGTAVLALIVAIVALVVALFAYTNNDVEDVRRGAERVEEVDVTRSVEKAAEKTESAARQGIGEAVQKTGEALESGAQATQEAGADIKTSDENMPR